MGYHPHGPSGRPIPGRESDATIDSSHRPHQPKGVSMFFFLPFLRPPGPPGPLDPNPDIDWACWLVGFC